MVVPRNVWLGVVGLLVKPGLQVPVWSLLTQVPKLLGRLFYRCFKLICPLLSPEADRLGTKFVGDLFDRIVRFHVHHICSLDPGFNRRFLSGERHSNQGPGSGQTGFSPECATHDLLL